MIGTARACDVGFKPLSVFTAYIIACLCSAGSVTAQEPSASVSVGFHADTAITHVLIAKTAMPQTQLWYAPARLDSGTSSNRPPHVLKGTLIGAVPVQPDRIPALK